MYRGGAVDPEEFAGLGSSKPIDSLGTVSGWDAGNAGSRAAGTHTLRDSREASHEVPISPEDRLRMWCIEPINVLRAKCRPNGGFAVLTLSFPLYERYARSVLQRDCPDINLDTDHSHLYGTQLAKDLKAAEDLCVMFWRGMRNGLLHTGMPFVKDRKWDRATVHLAGGHSCPIQWHDQHKKRIDINPWMFAQWVVDLWEENMDLADQLDAAPLGLILQED